MREAENVNFSTGLIKEGEQAPRKIVQPQRRNMTQEDLISFIKNKNLPDVQEKKLLKILKKTPYGSYQNFKNNYMNYLK
jgi:hypothetical protein